MSWTCNVCRGTRAVFDFSGEEPKEVGCVECEWHKVVNDERCVAPTMNHVRGFYMGRCSRPAILNGMCYQHGNKRDLWEVALNVFRQGHAREILPEAYREVFARACIGARLLSIEEAKDRRRLDRMAKRAEELREAEEGKRVASLVYFIRREGLIKIGWTANLTKRLKDISKGSSMPDGMTVGPVELLATTPGDRELERRLHSQFDEYRIGGTEWFKPGPPVLRLVTRFQRRAEMAQAA